MRFLLLLPLLLAAPAAPAQTDWSRAPRVEVRLSSFDFDPGTIRLRAGQPVVLRLVNSGGGGHNFSAPQFFAAARVEGGPVEQGEVELRSRQSVEVRLVPALGRYRLRCTHTFHTTLGMRGEIVVE
ncbi:MAG TPA: plastocyanin/azurin family copper-binding protein [Allosphingosinicella sp.]|nr:plastocyanin/azurin family copper-binding protein [Allosphingosinicella sp.]